MMRRQSKRQHAEPDPKPDRWVSRRRFLVHGGLGAAALGVGLGCERRPPATVPPNSPLVDAALPRRVDAETTPASETARQHFRTIEATGNATELGVAIGRATAELIRGAMGEQREWLDGLKRFAFESREARFTPYVAATEQHHPEVMAELRGIAQGAALPFEDIMIWNLQPELGTMRSQAARAGCSTIHLAAGGRLLIAHNEDGNHAFRDRMVILRARPQGRPAFTCLHYPGQLPGQVPAWNDAGLVVTTNFISTIEVRPGIPRYVLGRAVHGCSTIDEARSVATNAAGAFAFTLHLGSVRERRLACLEVTPGSYDLRDTTGLFLHTNHLLLPQTRAVSQSPVTPESSSGSRLQVLSEAASQLGAAAELDETDLLRLLSSHQAVRQPYSPCRHSTESSPTQTLAAVLLDLETSRFTLFEGNPCEGRRRDVAIGTG